MSALVKKRAMQALRGAFIGDAASMGTHWTYDPKEMVKLVSNVDEPEFLDPPAPKFYSAEGFPGHYKKGMLSPYGEQLLFVTEYVAATMKQDFTGKAMSEAMLEWANTFGGRPDQALKTFIENMNKVDGKWPNCGADDHEAHIYMKIVPVVARFAGKPELLDKITQAIKVHQNNDEAIAFGIAAARLLEAVILGAPLEEALETVTKNIPEDLATSEFKDKVIEAFARGKNEGTTPGKTLDEVLLELSHEVMKGNEDSPFYDLAARSCALPGSFIGPIVLLYKYASSSKAAFTAALRENILASGDTCSRAVFLGAVLAASGDDDAIPKKWLGQVDGSVMAKVDAAANMIVG